MPVRARLETVLTGDEAPFIQAVNRAERRAQSFQGRLQGLFKRDPSHRAGAALGGFVSDIASGDVQNAVLGITSRMRGLGLGITVATVAGIALYQGIKKAREESDQLSESLDKANRPSGPAALNAVESLTSKLSAIREAREALVKHERSYGPLDMIADLTNPENAGSSPADNLRIARERRAKAAAESFAAESKALSDIATKTKEVAKIEDERLHGSKRLAAIMESEAKFQEKYGPLIQAGPTQNPEAAAALKRVHALDIEGINRSMATREARQVFRMQPSVPGAYIRSPDAYYQHPDVYDTGARRTWDDKMLPPRRSGLDYFREHPRDFGFNRPRIFLKSDEATFYRGASAISGGAISGGATLTPPKLPTFYGKVEGSAEAQGKAILDTIKELVKEFQKAWGQ